MQPEGAPVFILPGALGAPVDQGNPGLVFACLEMCL